MIAEILDVPALTYATHIEVGDGKVTIHRQTTTGYEVVEASLPAVVSVTAGVVEPRYPTFKGIMDAKKKPVETPTTGRVGSGAGRWPKSGVGHRQAPARTAGAKIEDDGEAHLKIVELLAQRKVI